MSRLGFSLLGVVGDCRRLGTADDRWWVMTQRPAKRRERCLDHEQRAGGWCCRRGGAAVRHCNNDDERGHAIALSCHPSRLELVILRICDEPTFGYDKNIWPC
jgi:hypothetical protein